MGSRVCRGRLPLVPIICRPTPPHIPLRVQNCLRMRFSNLRFFVTLFRVHILLGILRNFSDFRSSNLVLAVANIYNFSRAISINFFIT